jgi:hypothetical protein
MRFAVKSFFLVSVFACLAMRAKGPNQPFYDDTLALVKAGKLVELKDKLKSAKNVYDLNSDTYNPNIITQAVEFLIPSAVPVILEKIFDPVAPYNWNGDDTFLVLTRSQDKSHLDNLKNIKAELDGRIYVLLMEAIGQQNVNVFNSLLSQAVLKDLKPEFGLSMKDYMEINGFIKTRFNDPAHPYSKMYEVLKEKLQNLRNVDNGASLEDLASALNSLG